MSTLTNLARTNPEIGSGGPGWAEALRAIAAAVDEGIGILPSTRGAYGTGGNDTVGLQTAVNDAAAAEAAAGGTPVVKIRGSGTHLAGKLLLPTTGRIVIEGAGPGMSVIQLRPMANEPLLETDGFDALVAGNSTGGNVDLQIRGVSLLGDKDNQTDDEVDLVRLYGRRILLDNVRIGDAKGRLLHLAWGDSLGSPDGQGMECRVRDTDLFGGEAGGAVINAHDMRWMGGNVSECGGIAIEVGAGGHGAQFTNVHTWGLPQLFGWVIRATGVMMRACQGEGAATMQILVLANDADIDGRFYQLISLADTGGGIQIGDEETEVAATRIHARLQNFHTGALVFANDAGLTDLDCMVYQAEGSEFVGEPHADSYGRAHMAGRAGAPNYFHQKGRWKVPEGMDVTGNVTIETAADFQLKLRTSDDDSERVRLSFERRDPGTDAVEELWSIITDSNGDGSHDLVVRDSAAASNRLRVHPDGSFGVLDGKLGVVAGAAFPGSAGSQTGWFDIVHPNDPSTVIAKSPLHDPT